MPRRRACDAPPRATAAGGEAGRRWTHRNGCAKAGAANQRRPLGMMGPIELGDDEPPPRPRLRAMGRGLRRCCPRCGGGGLFGRYPKLVSSSDLRENPQTDSNVSFHLFASAMHLKQLRL